MKVLSALPGTRISHTGASRLFPCTPHTARGTPCAGHALGPGPRCPPGCRRGAPWDSPFLFRSEPTPTAVLLHLRPTLTYLIKILWVLLPLLFI